MGSFDVQCSPSFTWAAGAVHHSVQIAASTWSSAHQCRSTLLCWPSKQLPLNQSSPSVVLYNIKLNFCQAKASKCLLGKNFLLRWAALVMPRLPSPLRWVLIISISFRSDPGLVYACPLSVAGGLHVMIRSHYQWHACDPKLTSLHFLNFFPVFFSGTT